MLVDFLFCSLKLISLTLGQDAIVMLLDVFYFGPYKMNLPTNVASFCTDMVVRMSCMGLNRGFTYYYNRKESARPQAACLRR